MEDFVNNKLDETHRDISEHDIETNLNATKMVIEKYADDHDDYEIKKHHRKPKMWNTQSYLWKVNRSSSWCLG